VVELVTGLPYRFKVLAKNVNGLSPDSPVATYYACLKPESLSAPEKVATTSTSVTIKWGEPEPNGCPITSIAIFRDTGNSDDLSIEVDPSSVNNRPSLRQY
jgi:hypothetical protein